MPTRPPGEGRVGGQLLPSPGHVFVYACKVLVRVLFDGYILAISLLRASQHLNTFMSFDSVIQVLEVNFNKCLHLSYLYTGKFSSELFRHKSKNLGRIRKYHLN